MTIWFATGNSHKRAELSGILPGHIIKIPADKGIPFDPDETGATFGENALIKARELRRLVLASGCGSQDPVIADDSGLCVDALDGRPGIYSARYGSIEGGKKLSDRDRNALLLQELQSRSELGDNPRRQARFVCAMVLLFSEDRFYLVQETLEGELVREERGTGGFGYDPILYLPQLGRTVAELTAEEKNQISHRGKAGKAIAKLLADG
ncbi:RdgB/HAM1 family non-canonical purine NTP pyrophosphatase [Treponema primitia]|uniref:RdgB/HAM1 family non-canonical purine NTP pyrophosphatase n=1 Tax=Treponema primitia TaxID=88058 RepID=UPI00397FB65D